MFYFLNLIKAKVIYSINILETYDPNYREFKPLIPLFLLDGSKLVINFRSIEDAYNIS